MNPLSRIEMMICAVAVAVTAIVAGCASAPPIKTETSTSRIRVAEEAGAASVPQAALHLQLAKEELELARKLSANDRRDEAVSMLSRAEADSELAIVLAHGEDEKAEAMAAMERVRQLRQDNQ